MAHPRNEVMLGELPFPRPSWWPAERPRITPAAVGAQEKPPQADPNRPDNQVQDQSSLEQWCFILHIMYTTTGTLVYPFCSEPYPNVDAANAAARTKITGQRYPGSQWDLRYVKFGKEGQMRMSRVCRDKFVCCYVCKYRPNGDRFVWERDEEEDNYTVGDCIDGESDVMQGEFEEGSFFGDTAPDSSADDDSSHSTLDVQEVT